MSIFLEINCETSVGGVVVWTTTGYCRGMQENRRNGQGEWHCSQGRNEVRWRPGQEASLAPACSNLRSFGSECTVLKKVLVTLLWLYCSLRSDSAPRAAIRHPRNFSPLAPLVTPLIVVTSESYIPLREKQKLRNFILKDEEVW